MPSGVYVRTEEHKKNISKVQKGHIVSKETRRKLSKYWKGYYANGGIGFWKGKHFSEEHKKNISKAKEGCTVSKETRKKISEANKGIKNYFYGKHHSEKAKRKISVTHKGKPKDRMRGEKHYNWKGGVSSLAEQIRSSIQGREWVKEVFQRDNYTCQKTGTKNGNGRTVRLVAHHIKNFSKIIEENNIKTLDQAMKCYELWNMNNGITLEEEIHKEFHRRYGIKNNTREQLNEFFK